MAPHRASAPIWPATFAVARKELRESFRDRQVLMYSVVLPICLYPVLFWVMIQGALLIQGQREHTQVRVALAAPGDAEPAGLSDALSRPSAAGASPFAGPAVAPVEVFGIEPATAGAEEALLADPELPRARRPDAVLELGVQPQSDEPSASATAPHAALYYDSTDSRSSLARRRVEERVKAFADDLRRREASRRGIDPRRLDPVEVETQNVAADEDMGAYVLSFLLPMLFVVMSVMGAFFPAVDTTAGERERGTAETTLLLPVPRLAVHQGKILAVCVSAVLATSLNLTALGLSAGHLVRMLSAEGDLHVELPVSAFASVAPLGLLFAFAVSAILTGIAALARTFKEGQALISPVQMLFILPGMAGAMPGLELTPATAVIPVVNIVLTFRTMLRGESKPLEFAITAVSLLAFAGLAVWLAVRVLSREEIQTSGQRLTLKRLATLLRSPAGSR